MNDLLAVVLAIIITGLLILDAVLFGWANTVFLLRKIMALIEWMAFWR